MIDNTEENWLVNSNETPNFDENPPKEVAAS